MSVIPVTLRDSFFTDSFFQSNWEDFEKIKKDMLKESRDFWERAEKNREEMTKNMAIENKSSSNNSTSSSVTSERKNSKGENISMDVNNKDLMSLGSNYFFAPWFFPRRWMVPSLFSDGSNNMASNSITSSSNVTSSNMASNNIASSNNNSGNNTTLANINSGNSQQKRMLFPSDFFSSMNQDEQVIRTKEDDTKFEVSLDTHDYSPEEVKVNIVGNVVSVEAKHEEKSDNKFVSRQFSRKYTLPEGCEATRVSSNLSSDGILIITAPKKEVKKVEQGQRAVPITMKLN